MSGDGLVCTHCGASGSMFSFLGKPEMVICASCDEGHSPRRWAEMAAAIAKDWADHCASGSPGVAAEPVGGIEPRSCPDGDGPLILMDLGPPLPSGLRNVRDRAADLLLDAGVRVAARPMGWEWYDGRWAAAVRAAHAVDEVLLRKCVPEVLAVRGS